MLSTSNRLLLTRNGLFSTSNGLLLTRNGLLSTSNGLLLTRNGLVSTSNGLFSTNNGLLSISYRLFSTSNRLLSIKYLWKIRGNRGKIEVYTLGIAHFMVSYRHFIIVSFLWVYDSFLVKWCDHASVFLVPDIWPLCCLSFDLRILITPLVSLNSS